MFKLPHNCTHLTQQQSNAQNSPSQASTVHKLRTSRCSRWIQKRLRNQRSNCQHLLDHRKSKRVLKKKSTSALFTTPKPLTVQITTNYGKFLKRWEYQTPSASCEIHMQVKKQQLELDMEQQTGLKQGKEFIKALYCHPDYLTYMQSTTSEMLAG